MNKIKLGSILKMTKGKKPSFQTSEKDEGLLPYVDIKAFELGKIENYTNGQNCVPCEDGDLLIVCDGSRSGLMGYAMKGYVGSTLAKISADGLINQYLYYFVQSKYLLLNTQKKGTGTPHLNAEILKQSDIVVPPLSEQESIVAKIEELFSELDNGVETLQKAKQQLVVYRQAVLKEAFSGNFTTEWRKKNNASCESALNEISKFKQIYKTKSNYQQEEIIRLPTIPKNWRWLCIGDISKGVDYGTSKKSDKAGLTPVIRMGNLQNGLIDWSDLAYTSDENEISKYHLKKNDVLFNRTNSSELVGKTAIYKGEQPAIFAGYLIRINQFDCINAQYLTYYLNSFTAKQYGNKVKTDGVNQSNINGKKLCGYPFPICSYEEQCKIVYELESRLSVCDCIEQTVDTALQQAEAMRQSILKQAFEGRLI